MRRYKPEGKVYQKIADSHTGPTPRVARASTSLNHSNSNKALNHQCSGSNWSGFHSINWLNEICIRYNNDPLLIKLKDYGFCPWPGSGSSYGFMGTRIRPPCRLDIQIYFIQQRTFSLMTSLEHIRLWDTIRIFPNKLGIINKLSPPPLFPFTPIPR